MELQVSGYAPPIAQTQCNFYSLGMHHQPHRYNGITIIWLCTTNNTDTLEFRFSGYAQLTHRYNGITIIWLCTTNHTDTMEFRFSGYAQLTPQIQWN